MKKLVLILSFLAATCPAYPISYIVDGPHPDADQGYYSGGWGTSLANILSYTGFNAGMTPDEIANEFYDNFGYNYPESAVSWWFSGNALYDDPGSGGGYYSNLNYADYYANSNFKTSQNIVADIDIWLHAGYGVEICLDAPTKGNILTVYGIEYDEFGYQGLWVISHQDVVGELVLLEMHQEYRTGYNTNVWVADNGFYSGWILNTADGLTQNAAPVPEPGTALLLLVGLPLIRNRYGRARIPDIDRRP